MIPVGAKTESRLTVAQDDTAQAWGSGSLPVLATPRMILMVEATAVECLAPFMEEGRTSVGTLVDVAHVSASPVGSEVVCTVEVIEVDRARVRFRVSVTDAVGEVGTGFHERFVVSADKFMAKANSKSL